MPDHKNPESVRKSRLLSGVPETCGVYIFRNRLGSVIYIGKAVNLRRRVMQYFARGEKQPEEIKDSLADYIEAVEWIPCETELHSLLLEDTLIKQYRPPYNRKLKKCLQYAYIGIMNGPFPALTVLKPRDLEPFRRKGEVFGPYTDEFAAARILDIVRKYLLVRPETERLSLFPNLPPELSAHRPPRESGLSQEAYAEGTERVKAFLSGSDPGLLDRISSRMFGLSDRGDYEQAARVREELHFAGGILQIIRFYNDFRNGMCLLRSGGRWKGTFFFIKGELLLYSPELLEADYCISLLPSPGDIQPAPDEMLFDRAGIVSSWSRRQGEERTYRFFSTASA